MSRFFPVCAVIAAAGCLSGCSVDPLAGTYRGKFNEAIRIEKDSSVYWQPPKKASIHADDYQYLGIFYGPTSSGGRRLAMSSNHPLLGTKMSVPDATGTLTVDWYGEPKRVASYRKE